MILCHIPRTSGTALKEAYPEIVHQHDPHATASQLRRLGCTELFSIIRNPAHRAVSLYRVQNDPYATPQGFLAWLRAALRGKGRVMANGLPWWAPAVRYVDAGTRLVRYEDLPGAMASLGLDVRAYPVFKELAPGRYAREEFLGYDGVVEAVLELYREDYVLWKSNKVN